MYDPKSRDTFLARSILCHCCFIDHFLGRCDSVAALIGALHGICTAGHNNRRILSRTCSRTVADVF